MTNHLVDDTEIQILNFLNSLNVKVISAHKLGLSLGRTYKEASAWAAPILKRLKSYGFVERSKYSYRITKKGVIALYDKSQKDN